jgi:hypothetical protein
MHLPCRTQTKSIMTCCSRMSATFFITASHHSRPLQTNPRLSQSIWCHVSLCLHFMIADVHAIVESDYTVVLFAAGGGHTPGWNWVWKAYRSLSRTYRKNLKQLVCFSPSTLRSFVSLKPPSSTSFTRHSSQKVHPIWFHLPRASSDAVKKRYFPSRAPSSG